LPAPPPLRTVQAAFTAYGSSMGQRTLAARGCPIGLGVNLDVTTAEPATELPAVAGAAPARVVATPPTYLLCPLRRLADGSRPPTPEGSLPACAWAHVACGLNPYPAHYRSAFACSLVLYPLPHRLALRPPYPEGKATGLPRSVAVAVGVRSRLFAGGTPAAPGELLTPGPDPVPFWPKRTSSLRLLVVTTFSSASPKLTVPHDPGSRPRCCWESRAGLASWSALRVEEATLSRELQTSS